MWQPCPGVIEGTAGTCQEILGTRSDNSLRSLYHFNLPAGSATIQLRHPVESVYYVISGSISISCATRAGGTLDAGGMLHVPPFGTYAFRAVRDAVVVGGPCPVDPDFGQPAHAVAAPEGMEEPQVGFYSRDNPGLMVPFISADARMVVWYGVGARTANMNYVVLEPGERNKEHLHRYSEDSIYILEGRGTLEDITHGCALPFGPDDTISIPPGVVHAVHANRGDRIVSVGGPCPADLDMLRAAGVDVGALSRALST
jgi:quercetin dioxygenase-like cupin family protein